MAKYWKITSWRNGEFFKVPLMTNIHRLKEWWMQMTTADAQQHASHLQILLYTA